MDAALAALHSTAQRIQRESLPACLPSAVADSPPPFPLPSSCSFEQLLAAIDTALQSDMEITAAALPPPPTAAEMCGGPDCFALLAVRAAAGLIDTTPAAA